MRVTQLVSAALLVAAVGCANDIGQRDPRDAASDGAMPSIDAHGLDAAAEHDASGALPDADVARDAAAPDTDAATACTPTHTTCRGELECGDVPDGCPGGSIDCGECGGGETWCAVLASPSWLSRVRDCVPSVIAAHPEYFDPSMPCSGDSPLVLDARAAEYVRDVAACVNGSGAVAIVDANAPMNEIRVRGESDDVADNYPVRVYSTGCTRQAYTSSCTPAFF